MVGDAARRGRRLRVARRRPAPGRVRARVREESSAAPSGAGAARGRGAWRRVGWAHGITVTGAALAAVAAVGGLWAQAVASYWAQQTARDQLSQSRDDSVRRVRDQASKVTYWGGGGSALERGATDTVPSRGVGSAALHVLNRSPDPVPAAQVALRVVTKSADDEELSEETWVLSLHDIPPCTHITYPQSALELGAVQEAGTEPLNVSSGDGVWGPVVMHFVDTRGREWRRTQTSLKEGSMPDAVAKPLQAHNFVVGTDAKVREVESCGDAGGGG